MLYTTAPPDVIAERMAQRAGNPDEASDADFSVHEKAARQFEEPAEIPANRLVTVTHVLEEDDIAERVLDALIKIRD